MNPFEEIRERLKEFDPRAVAVPTGTLRSEMIVEKRGTKMRAWMKKHPKVAVPNGILEGLPDHVPEGQTRWMIIAINAGRTRRVLPGESLKNVEVTLNYLGPV